MKQLFTPSRIRAIRFTFLLGLLMVSYQNCSSNVAFDASQQLLSQDNGNGSLSNGGTNGDGSTNAGGGTNGGGGNGSSDGTTGIVVTYPPGTDSNPPGSVTNPGTGGTVCPAPRIAVGSSCVCPAGSNDIGSGCLVCKAGEKFNPMTLKCEMTSVACQPGYTYDGHDCVAISPSCDSYVEVTDSKFAIPPRNVNADGKGKICYYAKLVSKVANAPSTTFVNRRSDIVSREHGGAKGSNAAPWIMGSREISFVLLGDREVVLAGDSHGGDDIYVDNYFLVEVMFPGLAKPNLWASGTADALPWNGSGGTMPILVNGQPVLDWHAFGDGGTSRFNAIDMYNQLTKNKEILFRGSSLDCGSVGESSNVYLLFR